MYQREYPRRMDAFAALAEPTRRRILGRLVREPHSVNDLAGALSLRQPAVSKHLKVLREAGYVSCTGEAQQRIYRLEARPFLALDAWLEPYRRLWNRHLEALERHLDQREMDHESKTVSAGRSGRGQGRTRRKALGPRVRA
jgi:DNA-binding transcriptional ArsR family regulator